MSGTLERDLTLALDERTRDLVRRRRTGAVKRRGWLVRRMLLLADVVGLTAAFALAQLLAPGQTPPVDQIRPATEFLAFLLTLPGWIVVAKLYGLYDRDEERTDHSTVDDLGGVFHLVTVGTWLLYAIASLSGVGDPSLPKLVLFWALAVTLVTAARLSARALCRRRLSYVQNAVIVGAGDVGQQLARKFETHPEYGINVIGFVDSDPKPLRPDVVRLPVLGPTNGLERVVREFEIERVIFAFVQDPSEATVDLIRSLKVSNVQVDIVPRLYELLSPAVGIHTVEGLPLIGLPPANLPRSSALLKRATDVLIASLALVLLAPIFLIIGVMIKLDSPGPVFFRQTRMGARGRPFRLLKFRTMTRDADDRKHEFAHLNRHERNGDPRMFKIVEDPRVTRVGELLRRYSLDELPQLLNVLRGEMSLVGPRPLILDEDRYVTAWAAARRDLRPGITGLWQVLGRDAIPFNEMVRLDYLYVTTWALSTDFKIIFRTLPVLSGGGR